VNNLVSLESGQRVQYFEQAIEVLRLQIERWSRWSFFVVADSSFYITHSEKLADIDFAELLGVSDEAVHLLIPMVVVDELDGLKRMKDQHARWRAGHTLGVLDRLFEEGDEVARLYEGPDSVKRSTSVEVK
jgi:hypothetical protein